MIMFIPRPAISSLGMKQWNFGYHGNHHRDHPLCVGNVEVLVFWGLLSVPMCTLAVEYRPCSSPGALEWGILHVGLGTMNNE